MTSDSNSGNGASRQQAKAPSSSRRRHIAARRSMQQHLSGMANSIHGANAQIQPGDGFEPQKLMTALSSAAANSARSLPSSPLLLFIACHRMTNGVGGSEELDLLIARGNTCARSSPLAASGAGSVAGSHITSAM
eukprot:CAMPEP_0172801584 /NCGR_PEP_ID=MMETSP1075-20121228/3297_1 /TAXON_ID=2916 /ORGANISM="Ceratium fusus, Strain PA161109" /LENGTH=134 /DNA_ID=CAMNT_0013639667 /DNA_START=175 /DNA_END=579 /DNA_ORIENTATION=-